MAQLPIQSYDFFMLVVLVGTTLFGAWKGMAWQLASLASVIVSAMVALRFGGPLAPLFSGTEPWNRFLAMLVLYLVTSLVIWLLFRLVAGMIDRVKLKEFDHQLGALFGLFKGALLCVLITFFAVTLSEPARQTILRSISGRSIARLIEHAAPVLPEEVRAVLGKYIEELDRKLDPTTEPEETPEETPEENEEDRATVPAVSGISRLSLRTSRLRQQCNDQNPWFSSDFGQLPTEHKKHYRTL